jgi:putative membrane protein
MKMTKMQSLAAVCSLVLPMAFTAAHAQTNDSDQDKTFLMKASQGGMAEVQLGQLAADKAQNPQVKAFGEKMVRDHSTLDNELKPFADRAGVPPPTGLSEEDQAEIDKLKGLSGAEFDRAYVADMMKDHKHDQEAFKQEIASTQNPKLKMAVKHGLTVIDQHLAIITKIGARMGVQAASLQGQPVGHPELAGR